MALDQKANNEKTSSLVNTTKSNKLTVFLTDGLWKPKINDAYYTSKTPDK